MKNKAVFVAVGAFFLVWQVWGVCGLKTPLWVSFSPYFSFFERKQQQDARWHQGVAFPVRAPVRVLLHL